MSQKFHVERDMGVTAYLIAKGFRFIGLYPIAGNYFAFKIADPDSKCASAVQEFWADGLAPGSKLLQALRMLKDELMKTKTLRGYDEKKKSHQKTTRPTYQAH